MRRETRSPQHTLHGPYPKIFCILLCLGPYEALWEVINFAAISNISEVMAASEAERAKAMVAIQDVFDKYVYFICH